MMNFEVNGIPYVLTFDQGAAQWCLFTPSRDGVAEVEIYNDGPLTVVVPPASDTSGTRRVN
jgi:hypothetical protein